MEPEVDTPRPSGDGPRRIVVVAAEEHVGEALHSELERRGDGRETEVRIVAPALADSRFRHAAGDVDSSRERAEGMLEQSLGEAREEGVEASGAVGDSDPLLAIEDALREFPADEVVLVTHDSEHGRWLEDDMFDRARRRFRIPVAHYEVGTDGHPVERDRSEGGVDEPDDVEFDPNSRNMPRLSVRDVAGIAVAIVGTIALVVIASAERGEVGTGATDSDSTTAQLLIAGVMGLINIAHIVGLVLFGAVRYRGFWERAFGYLSLIGTPVAIVISLLLA